MPSRASTRAGGITDAASGLTYPSIAPAADAKGESVGYSVLTPQRSNAAPLPLLAPANSPDSTNATNDSPVRITAASAGSPTQTLPPCDTTQSILYCVYTIQPGDTLSSIAQQFGLKNGDVTAADLLVNSNKPDIASGDDILQIGQKIKVPTQNGVVHLVRSGETLSSIAETYDVSTSDIAAVPQNGVVDLNALKIGQELLVPNPSQRLIWLLVLLGRRADRPRRPGFAVRVHLARYRPHLQLLWAGAPAGHRHRPLLKPECAHRGGGGGQGGLRRRQPLLLVRLLRRR
jgi:LysM repeat protein